MSWEQALRWTSSPSFPSASGGFLPDIQRIQPSSLLVTGILRTARSGSNQLRAVHDKWKPSADGPRSFQFRTRLVSLSTSSNGPGEAAVFSLSEKGSSCPLSHAGRQCTRALARTELLDGGHGETQGGLDFQSGLVVDNPHLDRVLNKLSVHFADKEAGAGAANIVGALLQLHLTAKDVESIFTRHRALYKASLDKKTSQASSVVELVECLLAFGLTRKEVGRLFKVDPYMLSTKSCLGWAENVGYLRDELKVARLSKVLILQPGLLRFKISKMRAVVKFLTEELGMQKVVGAVERHPSMLGYTVQRLGEKMVVLREVLGRQDVGPMLDKYPGLLYVSPTVPVAAFRWLVDTLGKDEAKARRVTVVYPQLLASKVETLDRKLRNLRAVLPKVDALALLVRSPQIIASNPETLSGNYEWLVGTFGQPTAAEIVLTTPRMLCLSVPLVRPKLEFVTGVMGYTKADVAASPAILTVSQERVLKPRFAALQKLGLAQHFALTTMYTVTDKAFQRNLERWAQPEYDKHRRFGHQEDSPDGAFAANKKVMLCLPGKALKRMLFGRGERA
eukprot:jgi/Mesen1/7509/ME000039S06724